MVRSHLLLRIPLFPRSVDEDLVKVVRVGEGQDSAEIPRSLRGQPPMLPSDFSVQILSGVRFASLVETPAIYTVLPSRIWGPTKHSQYPNSFRNACKEILLCAHSNRWQPLPPVQTHGENAAAILPRALWMEVLTYTTRDWFEKPRNTEDVLRRRLQEEQAALCEAKEARQRAEFRMARMERERDLYKILLLRSQARLRSMLREHNLPEDAALGIAEDELPHLLMNRHGDILRLLGQSVAAESEEDGDQEDVDLESESDGESVMEDATETNDMEEDPTPAASVTLSRRQPRTVSMSSDDA